jgi:hypothetical protein
LTGDLVARGDGASGDNNSETTVLGEERLMRGVVVFVGDCTTASWLLGEGATDSGLVEDEDGEAVVVSLFS